MNNNSLKRYLILKGDTHMAIPPLRLLLVSTISLADQTWIILVLESYNKYSTKRIFQSIL